MILRPGVQKRYVELMEPSLHDQRTDLVRLLGALDDIDLHVALDVVRFLPMTLRKANFLKSLRSPSI